MTRKDLKIMLVHALVTSLFSQFIRHGSDYRRDLSEILWLIKILKMTHPYDTPTCETEAFHCASNVQHE